MMERMSESLEDTINVGSYVIVKKQNYGKVYKVTTNGNLMLGKDQVNMSEIIGHPFWTTFEMVPTKLGKRTFSLKVIPEIESWIDLKNSVSSGLDNRSINDDGTSQKLSKEEICQLQNTGKTGKEIVGSLIENSKSFSSKTEYSQEKYIKKKEHKYCKCLTIHKPTISTLHEIYYKLDHMKIGDLRMDMLAQLLSYSDIQSNGLHILYDSGFHGLPAAALLNRIGSNTDGILLNLHPGNVPPSTIVQAMNFTQEQKDRLISVNIYSFLRLYYQGDVDTRNKSKDDIEIDCKIPNNKEIIDTEMVELELDDVKNNVNEDTVLKRKATNTMEHEPPKKPKWFIQTENAVELVKKTKARGLTIIAKEHPLNILKALLPFLGISRPFVVFHTHREPLQEIYVELKRKPGVINLKLFSNSLRSYQILPDRTHPDILTNHSSGYLLTGYIVDGS